MRLYKSKTPVFTLKPQDILVHNQTLKLLIRVNDLKREINYEQVINSGK